jgi:hypothetical protein
MEAIKESFNTILISRCLIVSDVLASKLQYFLSLPNSVI